MFANGSRWLLRSITGTFAGLSIGRMVTAPLASDSSHPATAANATTKRAVIDISSPQLHSFEHQVGGHGRGDRYTGLLRWQKEDGRFVAAVLASDMFHIAQFDD